MPETLQNPPLKKPRALPRSFNRVVGKLLAMPVNESIEISRSVWDESNTDRKRLMAMRLRLRVLHSAYEKLHAPEPEPPATEIVDLVPEPAPEPEVEILAAAEPVAVVPAKEPTITSIDLEGGALNSMFALLGDDDEEEA